ncbi:hypothetical protein [Longimicrobium sp.]|jgi:hypothetical protein|uniref:hypothetical protein n=1 Tax=Longimicrobium sp. TaxID=2029185 RepID=UPI002F95329E
MAETAKNYPINKAPRRIELLGDPNKKPEPAEHIIEFPGGAIQVTRTSKNEYWAHIIVNHAEPFEDGSTRERASGEVVESRVGYTSARAIESVPNAGDAYHIAVLIRTSSVVGEG